MNRSARDAYSVVHRPLPDEMIWSGTRFALDSRTVLPVGGRQPIDGVARGTNGCRDGTLHRTYIGTRTRDRTTRFLTEQAVGGQLHDRPAAAFLVGCCGR